MLRRSPSRSHGRHACPAPLLHPPVRHPQGAARAAVTRAVAVAGVAAFGAAALAATGGPAPSAVGGVAPAAVRQPVPAAAGAPARLRGHGSADSAHSHRPAQPSRVDRPATRHRRQPAKQTVGRGWGHVAATHAAPAARDRNAPLRLHRRWLPTGTGVWIYQWSHTGGGDAARVVRRARATGLSTLYLRTGSSHDGLTGTADLRRLLAATRHTGVHVVAWDFPSLRHPVADAHRLAAAARVTRAGDGGHVAAVAPDIETPAEGTFNAAWRVRTYLHALRAHLPHGVAVLGTVPWPSSYRIADYPYATVARGSDALVPMAYWYDNSPAAVTARSISYLRGHFHKPVMPVGQGYDGKLDVPSLPHNHLAAEVPRFLRTAHAHGARAVSIWSWQAAPPATWRALAHARRLFDR